MMQSGQAEEAVTKRAESIRLPRTGGPAPRSSNCLIVKGYGLGLIGNIVVGIVGAVIAGWLLPRIGFVLVGGILAAIVNAVIGP